MGIGKMGIFGKIVRLLLYREITDILFVEAGRPCMKTLDSINERRSWWTIMKVSRR